MIISAIGNFKTQFVFSINEVRDAIRDFSIDLSPVVDSVVDLDDNFTVTMNDVIDSIVNLDDNFTVTMNDLDNELNLLFQNLKYYIVTELLNIKSELINLQSLIDFDSIITRLNRIKSAIDEIDLQVNLALTELSNIKTELINIKSLINFDLIIEKSNEIKLAIEAIDLQVDFSAIITTINEFESNMMLKFDLAITELSNIKTIRVRVNEIESFIRVDIYNRLYALLTGNDILINIQLILNNNFNLILQSFTDLKLNLDLINQELDLIFQKLGNLNIDFSPITTKLNEIKLELNLTNIWAERIYDLLKAECVSFDPGLSESEYNNLPPLPIGASYCPFDPEEPPPDEELTQCPIDLWEKPPFPMYLMNQAIQRFPLDLVAGTPWPAPTAAADNNIEFFAQKININWLITGIDFLKYPALVSFLIWIIVAL